VSTTRRVLWSLGAPARWLLVGAVRVYQVAFSGALGGGQCRFSPGCSRYAIEAIQVHGALVGAALAIRRVLRCNPFGAGGIDPIPPRRVYDTAIHKASHEATAELTEARHAG
jgi:putative membrane protein insertion efficiency factor